MPVRMHRTVRVNTAHLNGLLQNRLDAPSAVLSTELSFKQPVAGAVLTNILAQHFQEFTGQRDVAVFFPLAAMHEHLEPV